MRPLLFLPAIVQSFIAKLDSLTKAKVEILNWLTSFHNLNSSDTEPYIYDHLDESVVRHIFRVACGLDSMVLGEPQILGQIKTAYQDASDAGTLGRNLNQLFQTAFSVAKKVRTNTAIGLTQSLLLLLPYLYLKKYLETLTINLRYF